MNEFNIVQVISIEDNRQNLENYEYEEHFFVINTVIYTLPFPYLPSFTPSMPLMLNRSKPSMSFKD